MVYSLQLTTDELERIEAAKSLGINVETFLKGAIASLPAAKRRRKPAALQPIPPMPQPRITQPHPLPEYTEEQRQAAIAYFEDRAKKPITDPEEIRQADKEFAELMQNLKEWR